MRLRHALVGAVLALPVALLRSADERWPAVAATLPALAGLLVLDHVLRRRVAEGTAFWTLVLAAYGTTLFPLLAHAPEARRAFAFLAATLGLAVLRRDATPASPRVWAFAAAIAAGLALDGPWAFEGPGFARALFGSRAGLLFRTPLLWACLCGLAVLARREGRAAVPLVIAGLLPLALAPLVGASAIHVALPALLVGLAIALDATCRLVGRRPAWALAVAVPLVAVSNLLFMEQYRYALRRDDTVSFPRVSEGNARLLAAGIGSPNAWPANWVWSARNGVPVERWDLLSGQRLDPRRGVTIDVGDPEQDAAFLLDGWSVRHECGEAVCREVEGRAEIVLPLERATTADLHVFVRGEGVLRVAVNGGVVGTIEVHGELADHGLPRCTWRRGVNRVVLESLNGTSLLDRLEIRRSEDR